MMETRTPTMARLEQISVLQLALLLVTIRSLIMLALLPVIGGTGGRDAWIASLLSIPIGLVPAWLACRIADLQPGKDLVQICEACLGKVLGRLVSMLYLGLFAMDAAVVLRQFSELLTSAPMPETPTEVFLGLMALTTAYAIMQGIEVVARANEITLVPLSLFILLVFVLGIKDMDPNRLKPYLAEGWGPATRGALTAGSLWGEVMLIPMLAPFVKERKLLFRYTAGAVVVSGLWLAITAATVIAFFSERRALVQIFPVYNLMRDVSVADVLERLDPLFFIAWTTASFIKLALLSYVTSRMMARILGLSDYRSLALPLGFLGAVVALLQFESIADVLQFNSWEVLPLLVLPLGVFLPALQLVVGSMRGVRGKTR